MDQWFIANLARLGFYRIKYDNASYMQLVDQLDTNPTVSSSGSLARQLLLMSIQNVYGPSLSLSLSLSRASVCVCVNQYLCTIVCTYECF